MTNGNVGTKGLTNFTGYRICVGPTAVAKPRNRTPTPHWAVYIEPSKNFEHYLIEGSLEIDN